MLVMALLCQGFLKKRKDKMKLRWVTYWFRLHNTTLFFYTKKHENALDLRGQYYIYEFQTVQEVTKSENNRYLFEIIMKNGKRKMLAADSAHVRQEWIHQLWKAMLLLVPDTNTSTGEPVDDLALDAQSNADVTIESLQTHNELEQSTEEFLLMDNDYDVLPSRKDSEETIYDAPTSKISVDETENNKPEAVYDIPMCKESNNGEDYGVTDDIYDVPNSFIRKMTKHSTEPFHPSERPESAGLLSDLIASLDCDSAAWVKSAPP
ncbi:hypothetical protein DNTS_000661 [Danionella cerebrum]|uniref:PH domain-containing protein n=1 Tax=Danionella cerebrum TaxID=2873325 RepID=A0A553PZI2_9TELE|nr:hypothetical protein DNTS_000661 [Danionella translucida]